MNTIKLSVCTKANQLFQYEAKVVNQQYILAQIYKGFSLPKIYLYTDSKQVDDTIEQSLQQAFLKIQKGMEPQAMSFGNLDQVLVEIDITKEKLMKVIDKHGHYQIQIREGKE